ncbi:MAG: Clp1/GlmU family protein [Candidatus Bathyarchaeota archaeon]|nr:Clp1/GlmU family protein [Candidatus Bathyarchaeota archaeon]
MKHVFKKGTTLLVDGPASVSLLSGKISVLGAPLQISEKLVVREGKRLPLWVKKRVTLELMLGEGASVNEVDEGTVPSSWDDAAKEILSLNKPVTVMVIGGMDSGKTSFCTFLANEAVMKKWRTSVIDADLGQSDVGPPSTVGFNFVTGPVKDLFDIDAQDAVFVGSTSPSGAINKVIEGLTQLKDRVMEAGVDFLVINTDGWVEGEEAAAYKVRLAEKVGPSAVVGMQRGNELTAILNALHGVKVLVIDSPQLIQPRSREKRKLLRELSYKKYLKRAKMHSLSLNWVKVKDSLFGAGGPLPHKRLETLTNLLGTRPIYSEETVTAILVVLSKSKAVTEEQIEAVEEYFGKRVKVIREGEEEGLLVGLKDEEDNFLGIGILHGVDYKRRVLKVYTPVSEKVSMLCFGQIKLDKNCREIGLSTVYSSYLL